MVISCVAYGCNNEQDGRKIPFHTFPFKRPEILKLWIQALRRDEWTPSRTSRLCGEHFLLTDYVDQPGLTVKRLKPDAVPSVFSFPKHLIRKVNAPRRKIIKQIPTTSVQTENEFMNDNLPSTSATPDTKGERLEKRLIHHGLHEYYKPPLKSRKCCVPGCDNRMGKMHRFPKNIPEVFAIWLDKIRPKNYDVYSMEEIYKKYVVCEEHFERRCKVAGTRRGLTHGAVPTLHLSSCASELPSFQKLYLFEDLPEPNLTEHVPIMSDRMEDVNLDPTPGSSCRKGERVMPTLETMSLDDDTDNPSTLHNEFIIKEETSMQCISKKLNILKRSSKVGERVMPTLETMSLDDDTDNSSTLHNEFIIKEETSMQSLSNTPTILGCSSKVSRSMSPNNNLNSVDILEDIKTHNRNIEVEYVDIKMENEDDIDQIVDEPNNVIDYITSSDLVDDLVETVNEPNNVIDDNTSDDLVGVGSSLEAKYNDLYKENQILKHLLTKIGLFPNLECSGEYTINTESNHLIDLTDIQNICRVCLQKSDNLIVVNEQIVFENKNIPNMTILEALQSIICDKVDNADNLPHQICTQCRNHLKSCVMFKHTFNRATSILHILSNVMFVNTNKQSIPASTMEDYDYSKNNSLKDEKSCTLELETSENYTNTDDMSVLSKNSEDSSKLRSPARKKMFRHKVKKQMNILHTCPICRTKMSTSKLIQHVKSHKTLEKYLSIRKVSSKTGFYAPVRDVQGLLIEEGETLHKCPICRYECKATEFILHVHHHLTNDQFKCEKCHCSFKKKSNLLSHMLVHSKTFPFRCMECGKGFVVKSNYERHLLTHEDGELPHKCIECGKSFSNPRHLSRHMTVHTENWTYSTKYRFKRCKYCGEGFLKKEQLVEHICHQYGVFKCKFCFKVFLNSRTRQLHTHKVHFNGKKTSGFCSICRLMFKNINYHKALKHPKANLKELCTVCGLYVTNIYIHMLKHRNVLSTQNYQCPICSKLFSYRTSLEKHLTIHSGVKPYISSP